MIVDRHAPLRQGRPACVSTTVAVAAELLGACVIGAQAF